jgi:predicted Zn-dependent protease
MSIDSTPQSGIVTPQIIAFAVAYGIIVVFQQVTQAFGYTLRDILPEKTLSEIDKERYKLLKSKNPHILLEQAHTAFDRKEYDWAYAFADNLLRKRPNDSQALEIAGKSLIRSGEAERAVHFGKRLVANEPLNHEGFRLLGDAYSDQSLWKEAVVEYEKALLYANNTFRVFVLRDIAAAYTKTGQLDKAILALKEYLRLETDSDLKRYTEQDYTDLLEIEARLASKQETD